MHCDQCGTEFATTDEERRIGIAYCPTCANGMEFPYIPASPLSSACWLKESGMLFTEQNVRDANLVAEIRRRMREPGMHDLHFAVGLWYDAQGVEPWNLNEMTEIGIQRYRGSSSLAKVAELVRCDSPNRSGPSTSRFEEAPIVAVGGAQSGYRATLRAKSISLQDVASIYSYAPTRLLKAVHQGKLSATRNAGRLMMTVRDVERAICAGTLERRVNSTFNGRIRGVSYRIIACPWSANLQLLVDSTSSPSPLLEAWVYRRMKWDSLEEQVSQMLFSGHQDQVHARVERWASRFIARHHGERQSGPQPQAYGEVEALETEEERFQRLLDSEPWTYMGDDWMD